MNQNINLYLPEFRKQKHWLDSRSMVQVLGAFVVVMLLATGVEYWLYYQQQQALIVAEQARDAATEATSALRARYGNQSQDQTLLDEIARLEEVLGGKQALLQFMQGRQLGNAEGFSQYLADLSRYHISGLSLQQITLRNGGNEVVLGGDVLRAENVPLFLQNLSTGSAYRGKSFQTLDIGEKSLDASGFFQEVAENGPALAAAPAVPVWEFTVTTAVENAP